MNYLKELGELQKATLTHIRHIAINTNINDIDVLNDLITLLAGDI